MGIVMTDSFPEMLTGVCIGAGFGLLGLANALTRRSGLALRLPLSVAIIAASSVVAYAATDSAETARRIGGVLSAAYALCLVAGSEWVASGLSALISLAQKPAIRWGAAGFTGLAAAVGSVAYFETADELSIDRQMAELEWLSAPPPSQVPTARAQTDTGREVALKEATAPRDVSEMQLLEEAIFSRPTVRDNVIRCQPGSDRTNCHGWVFTGGRFWVGGTEVDPILRDNGYHVVTEPQPGDLVVYRHGDAVCHTALVRYVTENQPVLVEGKWGCTGVYLHPVEKSIYGDDYRYYRSNRKGHLLAGIRATDSSVPAGSPQVVANPANPDEFTE